MLTAARNSLVIGVVASAVSTALGTMAGYAMYRYKLRLLPVMVVAPIAIPEILMGVSLLIFFVAINLTLGTRIDHAPPTSPSALASSLLWCDRGWRHG
jgi:spermidine/putrescine transport system permease protein